jgi:hypothetical protein
VLLAFFPMFGFLLWAPQSFFYWVKKDDLEMVKNRSKTSGRKLKDGKSDLEHWQGGGFKGDWERLLPAEQAVLLGTEQLRDRLIGYSIFTAPAFSTRLFGGVVVFGLLWFDQPNLGRAGGTLGKTTCDGDGWFGLWRYLCVMEDMIHVLGVSAPVWDWPTLSLSLRWPTELTLPAQLPLFVSVGFTTVELLLRGWRWASKRYELSTRDEIKRRLKNSSSFKDSSFKDSKVAQQSYEHVEVEEKNTQASPLSASGGLRPAATSTCAYGLNRHAGKDSSLCYGKDSSLCYI